jgi:pimeloyl-ACP methyl ester carboxylesterase
MFMLRNFTTVLFIILIQSLCAQGVQILEAPENLQLYARDASDSAIVTIRGKLKKGVEYDSIRLDIYKDKQAYSSESVVCNNKTFLINSRIDAGLHQFRFELNLIKDASEQIIVLADSVVCGDAYIITGQSNSHASSEQSSYCNPFCRSFGVKTGYEAYNDQDKKVRWGLATGNCEGLKGIGAWFKKNRFGVGAWGMELMHLIVENYQIPVCIINGGSGSSSIEQNMLATPEKASLETSFGRLAYRVDQAGLKDKVKALFWHQGEANSKFQQSKSIPENNYRIYSENFDILYKDWMSVYTGVKKLYLFQLHPGCGGDYQSEMREIQTQIASRYPDIDIMSTTAVPGHDGCHFSYEGYCEFAKRIFPLVARDFYGEKQIGVITPPALKRAYYSDSDEITLLFDQTVEMDSLCEVNGIRHLIKDQFFFDEDKKANRVAHAYVHDNKIVLQLNSGQLYQKITYLPNRYYQHTEDVYNGPWISGTNGIGALSFDKRNIEAKETIGEENTLWHGYKMLTSSLNGVNYKIVFPKEANDQKNWIWRARFWGHEPQTDIALLQQGFHLVYIEVGGLYGSPKALNIWDDFYDFIIKNYQLNSKVVLEGMSRGGLIVYNWANQHADRVACIYADAPVCDFKSWPAGKVRGSGSAQDWEQCLKVYGLNEKQALKYNGNPVDRVKNIAKAKIPVLHVVGDADKVVPVSENTALLQKKMNKYGWDLTIIHKPGVGHHPHSLKDPRSIVEFILLHTQNQFKYNI